MIQFRIVGQTKPDQKPYWMNPPALKCALGERMEFQMRFDSTDMQPQYEGWDAMIYNGHIRRKFHEVSK